MVKKNSKKGANVYGVMCGFEMNISSKAGLARGIQGTESLLLDSQLSVHDAPPVFGALGVIGVKWQGQPYQLRFAH